MTIFHIFFNFSLFFILIENPLFAASQINELNSKSRQILTSANSRDIAPSSMLSQSLQSHFVEKHLMQLQKYDPPNPKTKSPENSIKNCDLCGAGIVNARRTLAETSAELIIINASSPSSHP